MRIRLYVPTPLDISTGLDSLSGFSFLVDTVYNNCTWYPKHRQNEEDLEYFGSCEEKNKTDTQVVKSIFTHMNCILYIQPECEYNVCAHAYT